MTQVIAIIPVRYDSSRLPGKPLEEIGDRTLLHRVFDRVSKAREVDRIIIATDDHRIEEHARSFGAEVEMTFRSHQTGTDRCAQVARPIFGGHIIINVQGDQPFVDPELIDQMALTMRRDDWIGISSFMMPLNDSGTALKESVVKVVTDKTGKALYFSRLPIPYKDPTRDTGFTWQKHIGLYGFRNEVLQEITALPPSPLEQAEQLEQLRWLENGYSIQMLRAAHDSLSIDTPEDLDMARKIVL